MTARKDVRPRSGAASPERVMTMPEPSPLPKPMTTTTSASAPAVPVRGTKAMPSPRIAMDGMALARRETRSMMSPAG